MEHDQLIGQLHVTNVDRSSVISGVLCWCKDACFAFNLVLDEAKYFQNDMMQNNTCSHVSNISCSEDVRISSQWACYELIVEEVQTMDQMSHVFFLIAMNDQLQAHWCNVLSVFTPSIQKVLNMGEFGHTPCPVPRMPLCRYREILKCCQGNAHCTAILSLNDDQ